MKNLKSASQVYSLSPTVYLRNGLVQVQRKCKSCRVHHAAQFVSIPCEIDVY